MQDRQQDSELRDNFKNLLKLMEALMTRLTSGIDKKSSKCQLLDKSLRRQSTSNGYVLTTEIGLHKVFMDAKNWTEANKTCHDEGGYLAVINSQAEEKVVFHFLNFQAKQLQVRCRVTCTLEMSRAGRF